MDQQDPKQQENDMLEHTIREFLDAARDHLLAASARDEASQATHFSR